MSISVFEMAARSIQTQARIGWYLYKTPLIPARQGEDDLFFKAENFQYTGSFKFRGAMAKLSAMNHDKAGFITASSGNHGLASAHAAKLLGKKLTIVLPKNVSPAKLAKIQAYPVEIILAGEESGAAEIHARQMAEQKGAYYISPYNDLDIIAGQGTIGLELLTQFPKSVKRFSDKNCGKNKELERLTEPSEVKTVLEQFPKKSNTINNIFIAMGGGGLISGIGSVLKAFSPHTKIYGVAAKNSNALAQAIVKGYVVDVLHQPTLADGCAGGIDEDTLTLPLAQAVVDQVIECDETEIIAALQKLGREDNILVEGAAALALAGFYQIKDQCRGQNNIIVLCGGNFNQAQIAELVYAAL